MVRGSFREAGHEAAGGGAQNLFGTFSFVIRKKNLQAQEFTKRVRSKLKSIGEGQPKPWQKAARDFQVDDFSRRKVLLVRPRMAVHSGGSHCVRRNVSDEKHSLSDSSAVRETVPPTQLNAGNEHTGSAPPAHATEAQRHRPAGESGITVDHVVVLSATLQQLCYPTQEAESLRLWSIPSPALIDVREMLKTRTQKPR